MADLWSFPRSRLLEIAKKADFQELDFVLAVCAYSRAGADEHEQLCAIETFF
jgi:hypothetical protein